MADQTKTLYVATSNQEVRVLDVADPNPVNWTQTIVSTSPVGSPFTLAVAVSPDGTLAAFSNNSDPAGFFYLDTTFFLTGPVPSGGLGVAGPALGVVWTGDSQTCLFKAPSAVVPVSRLGVAGTPIATTTTGGYGSGLICIHPDGSRVYCPVGAGATCAVVEINIAAGTILRTFTLGTGQFYGIAITGDGSTLFVNDAAQTIYPIDLASGLYGTPMVSTYASTTGGAQFRQMRVVANRLYVADTNNNVVQIFDTTSHALVAAPPVHDAFGLTVQTDHTRIWVCEVNSNNAVYVDTTSFAAGPPFSMGSYNNPRGIDCKPVPFAGPTGAATLGTASLPLGPLTLTCTSTTITAATVAGTAMLNIGPLVVAAAQYTTRVGTAAVRLGPLLVASVAGRVGPGAFPVPGFRGRWRLTLHNRAFAAATLNSTMIAELADAYGRQLVQAWNTAAQLSFSLDGRASAAALIAELEQDVVAWRWDDQTGAEIPVFRGPITQTEDQITEQSHTVVCTCHDYAALLARRLLTATYNVTNRDQDLVVGDLVGLGSTAQSSSGTTFSPASFLPLSTFTANPDGSLRGLSGQLRTRTYYASQNVGDALETQLADAVNGYDWDVLPSAVDDHDNLRIFYPNQGVARTDIALQYGSTVATVTRAVNSADYANYVRVLGNHQSNNPAVQLFGEAWDSTATSIATPVGLWAFSDDAPDMTVQAAVTEKAQGSLGVHTVLVPHYTLGLTPDAYTWGNPRMGDTVPLIVNSGRLQVNTTVRVLGITYNISDDGTEDVTLVVGRPATTLSALFSQANRDIAALNRR
jgi:hypothetical protein